LLAGAAVFVVPSTSAANAGFTRQERVEWFRRLRELRDRLRELPSGAAAGPALAGFWPRIYLNCRRLRGGEQD
ncbi:MAG TPA: hypothetical protein VFU47_17490, partial [Armatimonadota bacterium]|nr:hypothetical protein [Armatimonadota bacterium]